MNILFLTPYITDFTAYDLWVRPLGLMQLAAWVKSRTDCDVYWLNPLDRYAGPAGREATGDGRGHFHRVVIHKPECFRSIPRNYARYGWPLETFNSRLAALPRIDLICMTTLMTYWVEGARFTLDLVRSCFPQATTVVGGILPTLMPIESRREIRADHHVSGSGEAWLLKLIEQGGGHVRPPSQVLPVDPGEFLSTADPAYPLLTSRGCPMHCSYCASRLLNPDFSERAVADVIDEVRFASRSRQHFVFFDDALLIHKEYRFLPLARLAAELGLKLHTPNGLHVREIDRVTAVALKAAGTQTLRLSLETTAGDIGTRGSSKVDAAAMRNAVEALFSAGFSPADLETYVLWGLPGQSIASVHATLDFVETLGIIPRLADYSPVPGTADFMRLQKTGRLKRPGNPLQTNKLYHLFRTCAYSALEMETVRNRCREIAASVRQD